MSTLKVEVVRPNAILPHPNADRLEIAQIKGWQCVVPKGEFTTKTLCVYFPIDSILPEKLEAKIFGSESKVKLSNHRVKTIKLRGAISQGLLLAADDLFDIVEDQLHEGIDVTKRLGVTKYEPPVESTPQAKGQQTSRKQTNPNFRKYTDIENYKNHPDLFQEGEPVWVLEKIHGTNFRAGWVESYANTWWKKVKKVLGLFPKYEFVYGSHNIQLQDRKTMGGLNVYLEAVEKYDLRKRLKPGEVVYGEIYGEGIQKGWMYDCKPGERKLIVFDIQLNGQYLTHNSVIGICYALSLAVVPSVRIMYDKNLVEIYVNYDSDLYNGLREGVVIKPQHETSCYIGRKILKWKSDQFLLREVDDTH